MKRYHPLLVALHWILALMIIVGLVMGGSVLSATPNSDPQKVFYLKMHMSAGMVIFALTIFRLIVRFSTAKPPHADTGNKILNRLSVVTHYLFYLIIILVVASGLATANMAGLAEIVFGNSGEALPQSFDTFPPRMAHGVLTTILMLFIAAHVVAFLYHQFVRKDGLFSRMWFGRRS